MKPFLRMVGGFSLAFALMISGAMLASIYHDLQSRAVKPTGNPALTEKAKKLVVGDDYSEVITLTGAACVSDLAPQWLGIEMVFVTFQASDGKGPVVWFLVPYDGSVEFSYRGKRFRAFDVCGGKCSLELISDENKVALGRF